MGELKFPTSHEWHIPKAKLSPTNGLAEVVKKNSPKSGEATSGGIFFSPRLLSHELRIILPWEYATSDKLGIFPGNNSFQCVIYISLLKPVKSTNQTRLTTRNMKFPKIHKIQFTTPLLWWNEIHFTTPLPWWNEIHFTTPLPWWNKIPHLSLKAQTNSPLMV